jgi:nicotinate-nucleotide adenylyltransferase
MIEVGKESIAILGGTFNPIHNGHIAIAATAHEQFGIDQILIMPSGNPGSYKSKINLASAAHRCNMISQAIQSYPYMKLSTIEIDRPGFTYTSDTLKQLKHTYPNIYFIIGADSFCALPTWHEATYVMSHCHLLVANRNLHAKDELKQLAASYVSKYDAVIDFLDTKDQPYSSTSIRNLISTGGSITGMVPEPVRNYIIENHLYQE